MKNFRHFKALMRKNFINWKRTPVGTALEVLLPICLMIALCIARQRIQPQKVDDLSLYSLRHPLYPIASPLNNSWVIDTGPKSIADRNLQAFIQYANYSNQPNKTYAPLLDPLGPYLMFPPQCYVNKGDSKYSSPLIGYIKTGSQLETDLISMMTILFGLQKSLAKQSNITQTQANDQLQSFQQNVQNIATQVSGPSLQGGPNGFKASDDISSLGNFTFKAFQSQDLFDQYIQDPRYGTDTMPAICFGFKASENKTTNYFELELMFNDETSAEYQSIPSQQNLAASPTQFLPLFVEYTQYSWGGFSYLQNWAANAILKRKSGMPTASITSMTIPMKTPTLYQDNFQFMLQICLTAILFLMYIPPLYRTVFRIVAEKESRVKESMRMMGMTDLSYWLSWFSYYSIINFFVSTLSWIILNYGVFKHSNGFLVWLIMWLFGQSLFSLILVAQSLFNRARSAAYITTSLYFGLAMMQFLVNSSETSKNLKILASFSPTVALSQSLVVLIQFETTGLGLTSQTISTEYQNFSISLGLVMLAIDTVIWLIIGMYLELILPKEFGKTRHPCFFFKKSSKAVKIHQEVELGNSQCFEQVSQDQLQKQSLVINQLYKHFGTLKAINGLTCTLYEDQIFVLLGHNGAGKTTTISVLTGLVEPNSYQSMTVYGLNIEDQMDQVRQIMGVCPQHDVLFDLLTPREHLEIFCDFKCDDLANRNSQILKLIQDVGLSDKQQALAHQLSGGNKRKLSVAIALCGNSKFILLDEPTSGMDLATRRQLWNMLEQYKKGRIILLTTHYMDEADILGDRIGIMSKGKLNCLGSSLFLKNRFGVGYHLNLIKKNNSKNQVFDNFLQKQLSEARCITEIEQQMIYQLPTERSKQFETLFKEIDSNIGQLDILSYGISISTLEDVFLKIGHLENPLSIFDPIIMAADTTPESQRPLSRQSDIEKGVDYQTNGDFVEIQDKFKIEVKIEKSSFRENLLTCLLKRFWIFKHNRKSIIVETIYPAAIMVYGVLLTKFIYKQRSPSRILNPSRISSDIQPLLFNWNQNAPSPNQGFQQQIMQSFKDDFLVQAINSTEMTNTRDRVFQYGNQKVNSFPYLYSCYDFYTSNTTSHQYQFYNHLNLTNQDATGLFPQFMYEKILQVGLKDPTINFKTKSRPYPSISVTSQIEQTTSAGTIIFMTAVAYSTLLTLICSFLVNERVQGLKHIQIISGIQLKAYWIGNFLFDSLKMYVTVITSILLLWGYNLGYSSCQYVFIALPLAVLPFTYVQSFLFQSEASSQTYIMFGYFMSILTLPTIFFTLRAFPPFYSLGDAIMWILRLLLPTYCLGNSIYLDKSINLISDARSLNGKYLSTNRWDIQNVLGDLVCILIQSVIWFSVLYLIEIRRFKRIKRQQCDIQQKSNDSDVITEMERIQAKNDQQITLKVEQFSKTYPRQRSLLNSQPDGSEDVIAVQNLNFGVDKGELFCLLGVNGAGKSTTFKALTCELQATNGHVEIQGKDISTSFSDIKTMIGYCPQWNSIFDSMTVEEHLNYYARAKGILLQQQQQVVDQLIEELNLSDYKHKLAGNLSGGNKRKLSVAIAIIGRPPLILLDEPSAGMDPEARRFMWKVVAKLIKNKECAVVLTTHDMEEAEALCTKLGIMTKGGVLQCFGSAQHIRQKFGQGYLISIKTNENNSEPDSASPSAGLSSQQTQVITELCREFQCVVACLEQYGTFMKLRLAQQKDKMPLGRIFGVVERLKQEGIIIDYSVNQTTLEQIFQQFANQSETSSLRHYQFEEGKLLETNVKVN